MTYILIKSTYSGVAIYVMFYMAIVNCYPIKLSWYIDNPKTIYVHTLITIQLECGFLLVVWVQPEIFSSISEQSSQLCPSRTVQVHGSMQQSMKIERTLIPNISCTNSYYFQPLPNPNLQIDQLSWIINTKVMMHSITIELATEAR